MTDIKKITADGEDLLPNITGCGDGLNKIKPSNRNPVPSSRKFTAKFPKDNGIKLKLEKSLNEIYGKPDKPLTKTLGKKSKSVAEITPSKLRGRKIVASKNKDEGKFNTLLATPRRDVQKLHLDRKRAARIIYERLLIHTWRRNRARLSTLTESSKRYMEQINQLQIQLDVLRQLRKSECDKREVAIKESHDLQNKLEKLELENTMLLSDKNLLEDEYNRLQNNLDSNNVELENYRNKLYQLKLTLKSVESEKNKLTGKLTKHENTIQMKKERIKNLEEELENSNNNVHNLENSKNILEGTYKDILQKHVSDARQISSLENEVNIIRNEKRKLEITVENLQIEISDLMQSYSHLKEENSFVKSSIIDLCEQKKSWWNNAKQLTNLSIKALKIICITMLPAIPKNLQ